ncbi:hypothetical protein BZA05DRAFT_439562 [Tricharina praecox]|uniref:uncharacterized protein n=1 Tax=Tricharina praecox TaxID=43433 RepID=UPI00221EF01C|nr:uncharacterized protein BZA05DRAFT_439562 [Tricharina praecox]KAI5842226.1 hypothetical protein BZA05DRAFT_439562 [Tricharina praecox]
MQFSLYSLAAIFFAVNAIAAPLADHAESMQPAVDKRQATDRVRVVCDLGHNSRGENLPATQRYKKYCEDRGGRLRQECFHDGVNIERDLMPEFNRFPELHVEDCRRHGGELRDVALSGPAVAKR